MSQKSPLAERERICPVCRKTFVVVKPSQKQRCCSHSCAFSEIGNHVRATAYTPEAIKKGADTRRGTGEGKGYIKRNGRHEHRTIAEETIGRPLQKGEVVHHGDENKRNNDPKNLEVLPSQAEHARLHRLGEKLPPKTRCKFGHDLTPENTVITSAGRRRCLTCRRAYDRQWKAQKRIENAHHFPRR